MDNIHNNELSSGSNEGNIDDGMGGNMNEGIQNNDANYKKIMATVVLVKAYAVNVTEILRSLMIKILNYVAYAVKI